MAFRTPYFIYVHLQVFLLHLHVTPLFVKLASAIPSLPRGSPATSNGIAAAAKSGIKNINPRMGFAKNDEIFGLWQMAEQLDLPAFVPYLLNRAGVQTGQNFGAALKQFRLNLQDWRILIALWQNDNQRLRDLAEITIVDHSTLSRQIVALEMANLVVRKRSTSDARALCIALTAKGRNLTAKIIPIARAHEAAAIKGLSTEQLDTLAHCLKLIYKNLKDFEGERNKQCR